MASVRQIALLFVLSIRDACCISRVASWVKQAPVGSTRWSAHRSSRVKQTPAGSSKVRASMLYTGNVATGGRDDGNRHATCFNGKTIIFIGPSTSRYDYLTLAHYLEYGVWPTGEHTPTPDIWEGDIAKNTSLPALPKGYDTAPYCGERITGQWERFWSYTNRAITGNGGSETCDCWVKGQGDPHFENRVYTTKDQQTKLMYFQWWPGKAEPQGVYKQSCPPGSKPSDSWYNKHGWKMPVADFLRKVVAPLKPTDVIIGMGQWKVMDVDSPFWKDFIDAGEDAVRASHGKIYFKTSPMVTNPFDWVRKSDVAKRKMIEKYSNLFESKGWEFFPAQSIIENFRIQKNNGQNTFRDPYSHLSSSAATHLMQALVNNYTCKAPPNPWSNLSSGVFGNFLKNAGLCTRPSCVIFIALAAGMLLVV